MTSVVILNSSYEPLSKSIPVKRAIRLVLTGKAEIVEAEGPALRSEKDQIPRPSVIRLKKYVHVPRNLRKKVSNTFLFARDGYVCQYCGKHERELPHRQGLTRDHILPVSRGGKDEWTNVATACSSCNAKKDNKLPHEAGMKLLSEPVEPHFVHLRWSVRRLTDLQLKWIKNFYGDGVVDQLRKAQR